MFEVGEIIICIDATIKAEAMSAVLKLYPNWIKQDTEYTIREILDNDNIVTGLLLEEVHNPPNLIPLLNRVQEPAFISDRFRKRTYQELEEAREAENVANETVKILEEIENNEPFVEAYLN